jgi:hypothetical protein
MDLNSQNQEQRNNEKRRREITSNQLTETPAMSLTGTIGPFSGGNEIIAKGSKKGPA